MLRWLMPYVVPEQITIYEAASAPESLFIILIGTCLVLPTIMGYTVLSYRADRQDFFGTHRDNVRAVRQRRFAMSLNLNDDYEGGALRFPEYGPHSYSPKAGTALVFATTMLHEALPVTRGQRWVLTTFFCDPEPQAGQRRA